MQGAYKLTEENLLTTPNLDGVPVDNTAEPLDADVAHFASHADVEELAALEEATAPEATTEQEDNA